MQHFKKVTSLEEDLKVLGIGISTMALFEDEEFECGIDLSIPEKEIDQDLSDRPEKDEPHRVSKEDKEDDEDGKKKEVEESENPVFSLKDLNSGMHKKADMVSKVHDVASGHAKISVDGRIYSAHGPAGLKNIKAGDVVLGYYNQYNQGAEVYEVIGFTTKINDDKKSLKSTFGEALKAVGATKATDESAEDNVRMWVKDLNDGDDGDWLYLFKGRMCRGSGAEILRFVSLKKESGTHKEDKEDDEKDEKEEDKEDEEDGKKKEVEEERGESLQHFNEVFFKKYMKKMKSLGNKLVMKLGASGNVADIEPETHGTQDHYEGYQVTVINKSHGKVASHYFPFGHFLKKRIDSRVKDLPNLKFEVILHSGAGWYIALPDPKEVEKMASEIMDYIEHYADDADLKKEDKEEPKEIEKEDDEEGMDKEDESKEKEDGDEEEMKESLLKKPKHVLLKKKLSKLAKKKHVRNESKEIIKSGVKQAITLAESMTSINVKDCAKDKRAMMFAFESICSVASLLSKRIGDILTMTEAKKMKEDNKYAGLDGMPTLSGYSPDSEVPNHQDPKAAKNYAAQQRDKKLKVVADHGKHYYAGIEKDLEAYFQGKLSGIQEEMETIRTDADEVLQKLRTAVLKPEQAQDVLQGMVKYLGGALKSYLSSAEEVQSNEYIGKGEPKKAPGKPESNGAVKRYQGEQEPAGQSEHPEVPEANRRVAGQDSELDGQKVSPEANGYSSDYEGKGAPKGVGRAPSGQDRTFKYAGR